MYTKRVGMIALVYFTHNYVDLYIYEWRKRADVYIHVWALIILSFTAHDHAEFFTAHIYE